MTERDADLDIRLARLENELGMARARLAAVESSRSYRFARSFLRIASRIRGERPARDIPPVPPATRPARVLVIALGLDAPGLERVVAEVVRVVRADMRVLFVVDTDDFSVITKAGFQYEFVPPPADAEQHFPDLDHHRVVRERIDEAQRWFRPTAVVVVGDEAAGLESTLRAVTDDRR